MTGINWGNLPTWLSAVGALSSATATFLALVFARRAASAAMGQVEHLNEQTQTRDQKDARAQADKVAAWIRHDFYPEESIPNQVTMRYVNASELPVYQVKFHLDEMSGGGFMFPILEPLQGVGEIPLDPLTKWIHERSISLYRKLQESANLASSLEDLSFVAISWSLTEKLVHQRDTILTFTDMSEQEWVRGRGGVLVTAEASKLVQWGSYPSREDIADEMERSLLSGGDESITYSGVYWRTSKDEPLRDQDL